MPYDPTPRYNLSAVVHETSLSADVLRAWERRYGLPKPQRTPAGHRLYSARDVAIIKWLQARREQGMRISRAVALWRELEKRGSDPLGAPTVPAAALTPPLGAGSLEGQREAWVHACLHFDEAQAEQVLSQAFAIHPPEVVCTDILMRGLRTIGDWWHANKASVQQEHFASRLALRRLENLIAAAPPPLHPEKILLSCPPEEQHVFPLLLLEFFLRRRGWHTVNLGADVPTNRLRETLESVRPALVVLAAQRLETAAHLKNMGEKISVQGVPLGYGGRIFTLAPMAQPAIPGHYLGPTLEVSALENITDLLTVPRIPSAVRPLSPVMRQALVDFQARRLQVETNLMQHLPDWSRPGEEILIANRFLGDAICAALTLGDLALLRSELDWLVALLRSRLPGVAVFEAYLDAYLASLKHALPATHTPISTWLALYRATLEGAKKIQLRNS